MKRLILLAAVMLVANTAVNAQGKVDVGKLQSSVAKLESDSQNPKRAAASKTWMDLGKAYYDAATVPAGDLYPGVAEGAALILLGAPAEGSEEIGGVEYKKNSYQYIDAYVKDGVIDFWLEKTPVIPNALDKAQAAYMKAADVDPKVAPKVREELLRVADGYKLDASNKFMAMRYKPAADDFAKAYELLANPIVDKRDTSAAYNAGFLYAISGENELGKKYLDEAIKYNYDSNGDAYFYLFHCYYALKDNDNALKTLQAGIAKHPGNSQIVEAMLGFYAETGKDPDDILPLVEEAISNDPNNPALYVGMGNIYDKMGDQDKAIETLKKAVEVGPNDFYANFNLALSYTKKGDAMVEVLNKMTVTSAEQYQGELAKVNANFKEALPYFEKANQIDPSSRVVVELLRSVYFRFREEPGMSDKYDKYDAILESMPASE